MTMSDTRARARVAAPTARQLDLLSRLQNLVLDEGFAHLLLDDVAARLRCSKTTLYALARSKEQLVTLVVTRFFKSATEHVEAALAAADAGPARLVAYLDAIARVLQPASRQFITDVGAFAPTRVIYQDNARAAARRVHQVVQEGMDAGAFAREVDPTFVASLVGLTIEAVQRGEVAERSGLADADAFASLSSLVLRALAPPPLS